MVGVWCEDFLQDPLLGSLAEHLVKPWLSCLCCGLLPLDNIFIVFQHGKVTSLLYSLECECLAFGEVFQKCAVKDLQHPSMFEEGHLFNVSRKPFVKDQR